LFAARSGELGEEEEARQQQQREEEMAERR